MISPPRSRASATRARLYASRPCSGSAGTPTASRSTAPSIVCSTCMAETERRVLHVLPHAGGGGDTYVDVLEGMSGYAFTRVYLASERKSGIARAGLAGVVRELRSHDVVHVHGEGAAALLLPVLAVRPSVITLHGLHLLRRVSGWKARLAELSLRAVVRAADRTICVSHAEHELLSAVVASSKSVVVPNGVRTTAVAPVALDAAPPVRSEE